MNMWGSVEHHNCVGAAVVEWAGIDLVVFVVGYEIQVLLVWLVGWFMVYLLGGLVGEYVRARVEVGGW